MTYRGHSRRVWYAASALLFMPAFALAQSNSHLLLDDWTKDKHFESDSSLAIFPNGPIGGGQSSSFSRAFSEGRLRLDPSMELSPSVGYSWTHIDLSSGTRLPGQLDDLSFAIGTPVFSQGSWFGGASVGAGYAGSEAFAADNAWYGIANVFVGKDLGQGRTLVFALDYEGNRSLLPDAPIPSVEFDWKVKSTLEVAVGFPVSALDWRPTEKFTLSAEYDFPSDAVIEAKYQLVPQLALDARYVADDDPFHTNTLGEDRRLFYQDNRVEIGLIGTPFDGLNLHAGVGYAWDRKFVTGFDDRTNDTAAEMRDQAYLRLGFDLTL